MKRVLLFTLAFISTLLLLTVSAAALEITFEVTEPVVGKVPTSTAIGKRNGSVEEFEGSIRIDTVTWVPDDAVFESGKAYSVHITFTSINDEEFFSQQIKINGNDPHKYFNGMYGATSYEFPIIYGELLDPTEPGITINEENFPDAVFREYVQLFDTRNDDVLTESEIAAVTELDLSNKGIADMTGIEHFVKLTSLNVSINRTLKSLNVSTLTDLITLNCSHTEVDKLDVSSNTKLETLCMSNNKLTSIDVSANSELVTLEVSNNYLERLDISKNLKLQRLTFDNNSISKIDISKNTALQSIYASNNCLPALDAEGLSNIGWLSAGSQNAKVYTDTVGVVDMAKFGDVSKISELSGGTLNGSILTLDDGANSVTYKYHTGHANDKLSVTLTVEYDPYAGIRNINVNTDLNQGIILGENYGYEGDIISLNARSFSGYKFVKWEYDEKITDAVITNDNSSFASVLKFTMLDEDVNVKAIFEADVKFDTNSDGLVNLADTIILARHVAGWPDYVNIPIK